MYYRMNIIQGIRITQLGVLRNKEVLLPIHVSSADNLADLFTKILDGQVFEKLRDLIMVRRNTGRRP